MELVVEGRGTFVGKHQGRIRVSRAQKVISEVPVIKLAQILVVDSGVALSSDVIRVCSEEGIPIHYIQGNGTPFASLYSAGLTGTVRTRRAQLLAYHTQKSVLIVKALIGAKIANQVNLLRYFSKSRKETQPELYADLYQRIALLQDYQHELNQLHAEHIDELRERLLSVEGRAAQQYWQVVGLLIPAQLAWPGRERRGAIDPFNAALNYGYGILYAQVERALVLAGLDPYAGFLHTDRPGKPSLVLDMIEEFRQAIVDRSIIALVNKHVSFEQEPETHLLTETTRKKIAEKVLERLEGFELYEQKRQVLRLIMQSQARHLALFLRDERAQYTGFVGGW